MWIKKNVIGPASRRKHQRFGRRTTDPFRDEIKGRWGILLLKKVGYRKKIRQAGEVGRIAFPGGQANPEMGMPNGITG